MFNIRNNLPKHTNGIYNLRKLVFFINLEEEEKKLAWKLFQYFYRGCKESIKNRNIKYTV